MHELEVQSRLCRITTGISWEIGWMGVGVEGAATLPPPNMHTLASNTANYAKATLNLSPSFFPT
jgi:hypothetical protein